MKNTRIKKQIPILITHFLCALLVMGLAVWTRGQSSSFLKEEGEIKDALTEEDGLPYLTDMDSYYHVRLLDNYLSKGMFGDVIKEDGTVWDLHSFSPEGRSAEYQPGIIWTTAFVHRLSGISLRILEYRLMAFLAAFAALAAYLIGVRISGLSCGLTAGILTGCGPQFALRTCYGRFDTDVFIIVLELCLILTMCEALRAKKRGKRILFVLLFASSAILYSLCWMPRYAILFTCLTLGGGVLYAGFEWLIEWKRNKKKSSGSLKQEWITLAGMGLAVLISQILFFGLDLFSDIRSAFSFTNEAAKGSEAFPNLFVSVSELGKTSLFPENLSKILSGYAAGESPSAVNGVGGLIAFACAVFGLILLVRLALPGKKNRTPEEKRKIYSLYAWVLGVWFFAGLFLLGYGIRFIEHLSIPVGLLAGSLIGWLFQNSLQVREREGFGFKVEEVFPLALIPALILLPACLIPCVSGAYAACADARPSVSDASAKAMRFIRENSSGEDALIESWWDMGYFYESASDHPCLWDGGSQNWMRGLLVARALVSDDLAFSQKILVMLAENGNAALEEMMEYADAKTAADLLFDALAANREEAIVLLQNGLGIEEEKASLIEAMIHPEKTREIYLIITYTMTRQIGWYEYFSNWDFSGSQPVPNATLYSYTPEGTPLFNTEEGQEYLKGIRGKETMWELFFNAKKSPYFTPAFEWHDGTEHVRVWHVEG